MDRNAFVEAIGWVFEHSPWVSERVWEKRPFSTPDALHGRMVVEVENAAADQQLALLRAHPDLGARVAMSDASLGEQAGAGLDTLTEAESARLLALNAAYREKFEWPFIYAVRGAAKHDILNALERRLTEPREVERREALRQVFRIARFRLEDVLRSG